MVRRLLKVGSMEECDYAITVLMGEIFYYVELSLIGVFHATPLDVTFDYHDD